MSKKPKPQEISDRAGCMREVQWCMATGNHWVKVGVGEENVKWGGLVVSVEW